MKKIMILGITLAAMMIFSCGGDNAPADKGNGAANDTDVSTPDTDDGIKITGSEGGECYKNLTCDQPLICKAGICQKPSDNDTVDTDNTEPDNEVLPTPNCGNGRMDNGEFCELNSLIDCTLIKAGYEGSAYCNTDCTGWDDSTCTEIPVCGDGFREGDEEVCDNGKDTYEANATCPYGETCCMACKTIVTGGVCGDGTIHKTDGEECDPGTKLMIEPGNCKYGKTCCTKECKLEIGPKCGDGIIQKENNEICDAKSSKSCIAIDPTYATGTAACNDDCTGWSTATCNKCPTAFPFQTRYSAKDGVHTSCWSPVTENLNFQAAQDNCYNLAGDKTAIPTITDFVENSYCNEEFNLTCPLTDKTYTGLDLMYIFDNELCACQKENVFQINELNNALLYTDKQNEENSNWLFLIVTNDPGKETAMFWPYNNVSAQSICIKRYVETINPGTETESDTDTIPNTDTDSSETPD